MSCKIQSQFAVGNMKIMEDCVSKLGYQFDKRDGRLTINNNIVIDEKGISHDSYYSSDVNKIKVEYSKTFAISGIEDRGEMYQVEENVNEVTILVN